MAGSLPVCQDRAGKFGFRLKAGNGQVVATGEAYRFEAYQSKSAALKGGESVRRAADGAKIEEVAG